MNLRSHDEKTSHFVCLRKNFLKITINLAHWVGHSKLGSLDKDELFKIAPQFDEKEASVTGNTEEEENAAEKTTDDVDKNAEEDGIIHKKSMNW